MAKYEVVHYADNDRGIGATIKKHGFFGVSVWVLTPSQDACSDIPGFDSWVNKVTGEQLGKNRTGDTMTNFYFANHITKDKE
jgi:hypothetical protein